MSRKRLSEDELFKGILEGETLLLSRAITLVESSLEQDQVLSQQLLQRCLPYTGRAFKIGITGVPGVGKSTFIDSFGSYLTSLGKRVAILAIDPSSTSSKGSILGDKTRMNRLSMNPRAFIRPSPTAGTLGGVAQKTREAMLLCDAAGFDLVMVETVGVGQSETLVRNMVDFFLLLMLPNSGDELQGIKKGIMEMADAIVINKADGAYLEKAREAKVSFSQALRLFSMGESHWRPKTLLCSSLEDKGMENCWELIETYRKQTSQNGYLHLQRNRQSLRWFDEDLERELIKRFFHQAGLKDAIALQKRRILDKKSAVRQASLEIIEKWFNQNQGA